MGTGRWTTGRTAAAGIAVAGVVGLGLLAAPAGAGAAPELPPVTPEDLVASVLAADPDAFAGTVELDNSLGLPALPGAPQAADGTSTARIWSNGEDGGRVQLPTSDGEKTFVTDGTTFWAYDSEDRTVTQGTREDRPDGAGSPDGGDVADPTAAATEAIRTLQTSSVVTVDGTTEVAGRPAYTLVLAPKPGERTVLREVRAAVDAQTRTPLELTVLGAGTDPVLRIGFDDVTFGPQDPALFTFTPPPGATVRDGTAGTEEQHGPGGPGGTPARAAAPTVVGEGWDAVVVGRVPRPRSQGDDAGRPDLTSAPWAPP
jgi:outer membrane lipoprotein-sorting protein